MTGARRSGGGAFPPADAGHGADLGGRRPLASGEPTRAQVERLLEVQQAVRARLGARADEIEQRYRRLLGKDSATVVDLPELISVRGLVEPHRKALEGNVRLTFFRL